MKLDSEFVKLPLQFDVDRLQLELSQFQESDWEPHPFDFPGNSAIPLVSAGGEVNNDYNGNMLATAALERCPYLQQVLARFGTVIGRSRLMRLAPGARVPPHCDTNYAWRKRIRVHIPLVTDPDVIFSSCDRRSVHMAAGDAWIFNNWLRHEVENNSSIERVHLVMDTTGSSEFWRLVERGFSPELQDAETATFTELLPFIPDEIPDLAFESFNAMRVAPPGEVENLCAEFMEELGPMEAATPAVFERIALGLRGFERDWRVTWSQYADQASGMIRYEQLRIQLRRILQADLGQYTLVSNGAEAFEVIENWLSACIEKDIPSSGSAIRTTQGKPERVDTSLFENPVFIVAAPRSGSTMLFEALQQNMELWTLGDESHAEFESIKELHPAFGGFASNGLSAEHATPEVVAKLFSTFMRRARNSQGTLFSRLPPEAQPPNIRFLEKTPKNALRIPFLKEMFPTALFIFLHREPRQNIAAIMNAWKSGNFVTYPNLPDWSGQPWSLLLPEGWRRLQQKPLESIAAYQWNETNQTIMRDLADIADADWCSVSYESLLENRDSQLRSLCEFIGVPFGPRMQQIARESFPLSKYTLSTPDPEKWRVHESAIEPLIPELAETIEGLNGLESTR